MAMLLWSGMACAALDDRFVVLSYHDVKDAVARDAAAGQTAVSTHQLEQQFAWLKAHGYHVVSVQDLIDARGGRRRLPSKAVLLTFDDGYASFYEKVFPLLRKFRYSAMIALVGAWMEPGGDGDRPVEKLLTWEQVKELQRSGLVEVASHTYDLHHGIPGNPQGNLQPAGVTFRYDAQSVSYETEEAYRRRIGEELRRSADDLQAHLGVRPRVVVWPYGESNSLLIETAKAAGMDLTMVLGDGSNSLRDLSSIRRLLVAENPGLTDFAAMMATQRIADRPLHVVHVDLDYIYDADPLQTERNLGALLDRIQGLRVNTVYLQAFADQDGDGNADALYFPNRHLPVRADLFNRVAWQLQTRARVKVYAWMPVLAFRVDAPEQWFVHEWRDGQVRLSGHVYRRLSPFNEEARRMVGEIYEDLAKYCNFAGVLFHDDAILSDFEDAGDQALAYGKAHWKLPGDVASLRATPTMRQRWAEHKTAKLTEWTDALTQRVRRFRPDIKTARNYYALPILKPYSEEWYAQSLQSGLTHYDYVAVEAMPFMEEAPDPAAWLAELVHNVARHPDGLKKTVFELQTVDWRNKGDIPMPTFLAQLHQVKQLGAIHVGYYPDNVFRDHPRQDDMEQAFALPRFP